MMTVNEATKYTITFPLPQLGSEMEGDSVFEDPLAWIEIGSCRVVGTNGTAEQFKAY